MRLQSRPWLAVLPLCGFLACRADPPREEAQSRPRAVASAEMARVREVYLRIPAVLAKNYKVFDTSTGPVSGFGAGEA